LLEPPPGAIDTGVLEVAGRRFELSELEREQFGEVIALRIPDRLSDLSPWPMSRLRFTTEPEDVLVVLPDRDPVPLIGERHSANGGRWRLDGAIGLSEDEAGSPVVSVNDGAVIGQLGWFEDGGAIAPLVER